MKRIVLYGAATAAALLACLPAKAESFDGRWQVMIITDKGTCDKAYSYPLAVKGGALSYTGGTSATVSGKVGGNGSVQVTISLGDTSAKASGRLGGNSGSGTWASKSCSGHWKASRAA